MAKLKMEFSIVDVETTGLFPGHHDRIIEIAIIRVTPTGKILREYSSLINPNRDVGRTDIHGITAKQLVRAPVFMEVAGDVLTFLAGSVFVAHNVNFDLRFVKAEIERLNCNLPDFPFLCTMQLARKADPSIPSRQLGELCRHFGIVLSQAHSAYDDASATVRLFSKCLSLIEKKGGLSLQNLGVEGDLMDDIRWPNLPCSGRAYSRADANIAAATSNSYMANLVSRLPAKENGTPALDDYLALLDRVLEDRQITLEETEALHSLAMELGISKRQAKKAHLSYLDDLILIAMEDGTITTFEEEDLQDVRELLGISETALSKLIRRAKKNLPESDSLSKSRGQTCKLDLEGKTICFTGSFRFQRKGTPVPRSFAEKIATEQGMTVKRSVSRSLDILVATDPCSMSGKAKKAREYGIRIITEPVFWRLVNVKVE